MKRNEIKRTVEEVVRVEYVAEDGQAFYSEEECRKYEESALFTISNKLKRLTNKWTSQYALNESGNEEEELEIFDVQTEEDLENLRRYLYLKATKNGASENYIKDCFTSPDGIKRKDFVFDNVTAGHEVLVFWSYENDWFWVYGDGSLDGYLNWIKDKYNKIVAPQEETQGEN